MLAENLPIFRDRVLKQYERSEAFLKLRTGGSKDRSYRVLEYILQHGYDFIRRSELKKQFVSKKQNPKKMSDHELTRALDYLEDAEFMRRKEVTPESRRTPGRTKPDVYYGVHMSRMLISDGLAGDERAGFLKLEAEGIFRIDLRKGLPNIAKEELREMDTRSMSDEELDVILEAIAIAYARDRIVTVWRWAMRLPDEERYLRTLVLNWYKRNEKRFSSGASTPIEEIVF